MVVGKSQDDQTKSVPFRDASEKFYCFLLKSILLYLPSPYESC